MMSIREDAAARLRRDHEYMIELAQRIAASCSQKEKGSCSDCNSDLRQVCNGNVDQLIRTLVETTQKHSIYESLLMQDGVPLAHRLAHKQAHTDLVGKMQAIRLVFDQQGDCIVAIDGIEAVLKTLLSHHEDFDRPLEGYLFAAA